MSDDRGAMGGQRAIPRRDALRITAVAGLSAALGGGLWSALARRAGLHEVSETRTRMGTLVNVTVVHPEAEDARAMVGSAFGEMERLESVLSRYRPESPVSTLNSTGRVAAPPAELVEVLDCARSHWVATDGAFDVTIAPLLSLYKRTFEQVGAPPAKVDIDAARRLVDAAGLVVTRDALSFERPGMAVSLDGIAKGYIVDRTVGVLTRAGAENVMVDAGGDLLAHGGVADDDGWEVGIQDPRDGRRLLGSFRVQGQGVATSGDYMQSFTADRAHHHIVDPRTGRSPEHTSSVTVVAPTAMDADALSTAVMVLGPDEGIRLLDRLDAVEGLVVTKDQREVVTRGFGSRRG